MDDRIGFVGAGQMAEALMVGLIQAGVSSPDKIITCDVSADRLKYIQESAGVSTSSKIADVVQQSQIVVLAVKPNIIPLVLPDISEVADSSALIVSIAAGISLKLLEAGLPPSTKVVRVMPNTPCLVGETAAAYAMGTHATEADGAKVQLMLDAVGRAYAVEEKLLDAVTGLSGSGPAFVYMIIEALADGGVRAGLPRQVAQELAAQTVLGSAKMVLETGLHPGALKDMVASPGGTTIAGIHELEKAGLRGALMNAVDAAARRSQELGKS